MIYGVDIGMRRLAVASPSFGVYASIDLGKKVGDRHVELSILSSWFAENVPEDATAWVESPIAGLSGNVQTAVKIAMTAGAIFGVPRSGAMHLVAPSSWKAAVVGHGHADKDAVREWVERTYPESASACAGVEDRYDAAAIARYGELAAGGELEPKRRVSRPRNRRVLRG